MPTTYEDWKHCIAVKCDIPLTPEFVEQRIAALTDKKDYRTQRFVERWGTAHHARTLAWFKRAETELAGAN